MNTVRSPRKKYKRGKVVRSGRSGRGVFIIVAVVVVFGTAAILAVALGSKHDPAEKPAPRKVIGTVALVPASTFDAVGRGSAAVDPKPISGPLLRAGGKPQILYVGAEYCPYCATERWPMVVALSRFGTFSGLKVTHSSSTDQFPNTATFSFHGAAYSSRWIDFTGVETATNRQQGDGYAPLDKLTTAQQTTFETYDQPPYVSSESSGGIPFIDFGGRYVITGATYDPGLLQHKSVQDIADAVAQPNTSIDKGVIGAANTMTAAICRLTDDQPAGVCRTPVTQRLEAAMH
jgi:hypothetical protein